MLEPGAVVCGKYRIEQLLGKGGMALVARARHLDLDQPVAIKLLLPEVLKNEGMVKRFRREALAMVQLKSEHVCRVFDIGVLDSGAPFMVMEYLEGKDLDAILQEQGRLAPGFAVDLVLQACEALAEAHALGIVHRDIKPANCFLTLGPDGEPLLKVLDFGISKALGFTAGAITTSQTLIGSPVYMSPEQMRCSHDVDARVDIWALGVVLYELLSGRQPFLGDNFAALCLAVTTRPVPPLDDVQVPDGLTEVISRCLEKQPEDRFANIAELCAALAPFAGTSAQGERSRVRTARMLGRANSPALARAAIADGVPAGVRARPRDGEQATSAGAGAARRPALGRMSALSTVTSTPVPVSARGKHTIEHDMTQPMTRPRRGRPWPSLRRLWPVPIGLGMFVSIVVLSVVHGGRDRSVGTARPASGDVAWPDAGARTAPAVDGSRAPATPEGTGVQAPPEVEAEVEVENGAGAGTAAGARGLDAAAQPGASVDDRAPDVATRGQVGSDAGPYGEGATHELAGEAVRRPHHRASRGGERRGANGRVVSPRESSAPSQTDGAERQRRDTKVESLLDDAAFDSRE